jgi:hypothetical protein
VNIIGKTDKLDKLILPLVEAMNATGWIETVSSCQGHPKSEHHQKPYIAFYCKSSMIKRLCRMLNQVETRMDEWIWLDLFIVHSDNVNGCQEDAKRGWLALHLGINVDTPRAKRRAIELMTEGFKGYRQEL